MPTPVNPQFTSLVLPGLAIFATMPGRPRYHRRFVEFLVTAGSRFSPGTKAVMQEEEEGLED